MSILVLIAYYLNLVVVWTWRGAWIVGVLMGVWALVDTLSRPAQHFVAADKRTKGFWTWVNALSTGAIALTLFGSLLGSGGTLFFLSLLAVVASAVYLADAKPALDYYKPVRVRSQVRKPGQSRPGSSWRSRRGGGRWGR